MTAGNTDDPALARQLIEALCRTRRFPHPVDSVRVIETHISWVLLTGEYAYKLKKPVALGFVDFSRFDQRHAACLEELRLNRRLAPELYVAVVPITGTPREPSVGGEGPPIEHAVQMRQFPQASLLTLQLAAGLLEPADMEKLGERIADFHAGLPPADPGAHWGSVAAIREPVMQSIAQIEAIGLPERCRPAFAAARQSLTRGLESLAPAFARRLTEGRVRECHGDLHLGNLVRTDAGITAFDALEFDPALRWIDVASEVAFPAMDLLVRGRADIAFAFLNRYLARSGDYGALGVLTFYMGYRALVRAKVALLAPPAATAARLLPEPSVEDLLNFAAKPLAGITPLLALTCGVSGSGKTWLARQLAGLLPAIHVRSDVERKRLAGLAEIARSGSPPAGGIYTAASSAATYARLREAAGAALDGGFNVILDATYRNRSVRAALVTLARERGCAAAILYCRGDPALLARRIARRSAAAQDASEADVEILRRQLASFEPPAAAEADVVIEVDAGGPIEPAAICDRLRTAVSRR